MPTLELEFEVRVELGEPHDVGLTPLGHRMIGTTAGGEITGERLKGTFVGAGGDWLTVGTDGIARGDTRHTVKTVDGALIYLQSLGLLEMSPALGAVLAGGDQGTEWGDPPYYVHFRAETADERYAWLHRTMLIGEGRFLPGPILEMRVFRVVP